jgi:hypothetical protein
VAELVLVRPMRAPPLAVTFLASLLATSAHARVGDTVKQIEARYGKPQHVYVERPGIRQLGYRFRGLMVIVYFKDGISKWESFTGWPEGDRLPRLSRQTVNKLLALSAREGTNWQPIPRTKNGEYCVSSDKKTLAFFADEGKSVLVRDPNFSDHD